MKATVIGAAGGIGQPLSLLLKQNPLIKELSLYDVVNAKGVAADLGHINSASLVHGFVPDNNGLVESLRGTNIVVIPAGMPRKPGMSRDDLFNANGSIVHDIAEAIAKTAPKAFVLVISNPVNSMVPIVAEVFKKHNAYDPKRLFGVTTLDLVRASTFVAEANGKPHDAADYVIPVVGGHSGVTIVPLISQSKPALTKDDRELLDKLTHRIQFGGDEVVEAKNGAGSATLSMAFAAARFSDAVIQAALGKRDSPVVYSYVDLAADPKGAQEIKAIIGDKTPFFSVPLQLGPEGIVAIKPFNAITEFEKTALEKAVDALKDNITKGVEFKSKV
ncbi:malate dehydrogenase [Malassezia vespertilionis]|uniref:Malate dehydrogenase n=1 Tax=Malassezia vespertilionis TaxID=2020962 RepID=A0A2N1JEX0_9BASI|nr:malate dehydrogenase [Malassezia vespertilionis]PKI85092.1 hypothetical protein MVES_001358 [Malassezia vespertilionis]WFD06100.1 malate dehydrogenase [Malassezia vespertilionis]